MPIHSTGSTKRAELHLFDGPSCVWGLNAGHFAELLAVIALILPVTV